MAVQPDKQQILPRAPHSYTPVSSGNRLSTHMEDSRSFVFNDMRSEALIQRRLKMAIDSSAKALSMNGTPTIQRVVMNEKTGYRLDKFNRPGERAQEIASALYTHLYRSGVEVHGFDCYYDKIFDLLKSSPTVNQLIDDDDNVVSMNNLVEHLLAEPSLMTLSLAKPHDATADKALSLCSVEKVFFRTGANKVIAYPAKKENEDGILREMWLYEELKKIEDEFHLEMNLPNPELIYNEARKQYGIKMDYIPGVNVDVYARKPEEIKDMVRVAAGKLEIDEGAKETWVKTAFEGIDAIMKRLKAIGITIYDLQGILDERGVWTIIDPLNIVRESTL